MLKTEKKYLKILNEQIVNSDDIRLFHIGGTSVLGAEKPVAKLEPISIDHEDGSVLGFKNDLSSEEDEGGIDLLKPISDNFDEISLLKFKKELSQEISGKLIEPLELVNKDKQESGSFDPYNLKLAEFINKFSLEKKE